MVKGAGLAMCGMLVVSLAASAAAAHSRPPTRLEQARIAAEVKLTLSIDADSPSSGISHGTEVLLAPICISSVDARYASAVLIPFIHGKIAQPALAYLHRAPHGYRVVPEILTGLLVSKRPIEVPERAYEDLSRRACKAPSLKRALELRAKHLAPDFRI